MFCNCSSLDRPLSSPAWEAYQLLSLAANWSQDHSIPDFHQSNTFWLWTLTFNHYSPTTYIYFIFKFLTSLFIFLVCFIQRLHFVDDQTSNFQGALSPWIPPLIFGLTPLFGRCDLKWEPKPLFQQHSMLFQYSHPISSGDQGPASPWHNPGRNDLEPNLNCFHQRYWRRKNTLYLRNETLKPYISNMDKKKSQKTHFSPSLGVVGSWKILTSFMDQYS